MVVIKVIEEGSKVIICVFIGNIFVVVVVYVVCVGIMAFVLIFEGKIVMGKLVQVMMYGVIMLQICGNFDVGMQFVKDVVKEVSVMIVNLINLFCL